MPRRCGSALLLEARQEVRHRPDVLVGHAVESGTHYGVAAPARAVTERTHGVEKILFPLAGKAGDLLAPAVIGQVAIVAAQLGD